MTRDLKYGFLLIVLYVLVSYITLFCIEVRRLVHSISYERGKINLVDKPDVKTVVTALGSPIGEIPKPLQRPDMWKMDRVLATPTELRHGRSTELKLEKHEIQRYNFFASEKRDLQMVSSENGTTLAFLYSAVAGNSSNCSQWDRFSVIGWFLKSHEHLFNRCCVSFSSGLLKEYPVVPGIARSINICPLLIRQITCAVGDFENHANGTDKPVSMSVSTKSGGCRANPSSYVDIVYPYRQAEKVALFGRIVYGNISALNLLAWFEIHRIYGYHKVLMYTYNIGKEAEKVLDYYKKIGLLENVRFTTPGPGQCGPSKVYKNFVKEYGVTDIGMGNKSSQGFSYDLAAHADALERLRGYKYLVSIDIDEYLIPSRHSTWSELFDDMWKTNQSAATFKFKTYFYKKKPELSMTDSPFDVCRFLGRSRLIHKHPKQVLMPDRVVYGGLSSHGAILKKGYISAKAKETDVVMRHYRSCKQNDRGSKFYCRSKRIRDDTVYRVFKGIEKDVLAIATKLELSM